MGRWEALVLATPLVVPWGTMTFGGEPLAPLTQASGPPALKVVPGPWEATEDEVALMARNVTTIFAEEAGWRPAAPLEIFTRESNPRTLYDRGKGGQIQIGLSARRSFWPKYIYQFAHELGHQMANMRKTAESDRNAWFEERSPTQPQCLPSRRPRSTGEV